METTPPKGNSVPVVAAHSPGQLPNTPRKPFDLDGDVHDAITETPRKNHLPRASCGKGSESTGKHLLDQQQTDQKGTNKRMKLAKTSSDEQLNLNDEEGFRLEGLACDDLDRQLDENAVKNNLTQMNIKSIINSVIRNEDVITMLKNSLEEDTAKHTPARYEPKMTRAKMKEVLEKEGNIPYPWPLSPLKKSSLAANRFCDLMFPEDDDDPDYNPAQEPAEISDDDESVYSQASDLGSPMCRPDTSPSLSQSPSLVLPSLSARHPQLPQTIGSMGPPMASSLRESQHSFFSALDKLDLPESSIAKRTRSKLPLTHTTIDTLEAEFVPPDITVDMYGEMDIEDEDPEWKNFLATLFRTDLPHEDEDDPDADPEYNILTEPCEDTEEELILPLRVTKNEINELLDDFYAAEFDNDDDGSDAPISFNVPQPLKGLTVSEMRKQGINPKATQQTAQKKQLPKLMPSERLQLRRQMEMYIQILSQQFLVSGSVATALKTQCKLFLNELNMFATHSPARERSAFNACNLSAALQLIGQYDTHHVSDPKADTKTSKKALDKQGDLSPELISLLASSAVFMYPEILPRRILNLPRNGRPCFLPQEDALICMGLSEFKNHHHNYYYYISSLLTPVFTPNMIQLRVKNSMANQTSLIYQFKHGKVTLDDLRLPRSTESNDMLEPIKRPYKPGYPEWLKFEQLKLTSNVSPGLLVVRNVDDGPAAASHPIPESSSGHGQNSNCGVALQAQAGSPSLTALPINVITPKTTEACVGVDIRTNPCAESSYNAISSTGCSGDSYSNTDVTQSCRLSLNKDRCSVLATEPVSAENGVTTGPCDSRIMGMFAELSDMFAADTSALDSAVVMVTPTQKVVTPIKSYSPALPPCQIAPANMKTPEKASSSASPQTRLAQSSPRRMELRTRVAASIPKSFIPTVFKPSPTKQAAKALTARAVNTVNRKRFPSVKPLEKTHVTPSKRRSGGPERAEVCVADAIGLDDDDFTALIEASSTIRNKSSKKHRYLACLAPDIVETDPKRIEREDAFACSYLLKVKARLGENSAEYANFLEGLISFAQQKKNPAEMFSELKATHLADHLDLVEDFAAFLLPSQALACGEKCYRACKDFSNARRFLRKLEVYFGGNTASFRKMISMFSRDGKVEPSKTEEIKRNVFQMLKTHPLLLNEFKMCFPDEAPPKRHADDYEDMDLTDMDEDTMIDGFEEMQIPEIEPTNATSQCKCVCHREKPQTAMDLSRQTHCPSCRIGIFHNRLFIHMGPRKGLKPAYIRYLNPIPPSNKMDSEEDDDNDSDNSFLSYHGGSPFMSTEDPPVPSPVKSLSPTRSPQRPAAALKNGSSHQLWTMDEDRLLLEAMKSEDTVSLSEDVFRRLSLSLHGRTVTEIQGRLNKLLELLAEELSEESESSNEPVPNLMSSSS